MLNEQELSQKFNDMSHEELVRYAVQLQMANQNFKEQLQLIRARKFGHTSEKLAELQLNNHLWVCQEKFVSFFVSFFTSVNLFCYLQIYHHHF